MSAAGTAAASIRTGGAGKVGKTPEGMGRVGLAGGREKVGGIRDLDLEGSSHVEEVRVLDQVVPPDQSGDSAVRASPPQQVKDEL